MNIAICDTSSLIKLHNGNVLDCLKIFNKIYIPEAVKNECLTPDLIQALQDLNNVEVKKVRNILPIGMGAGEREAISLAVKLGIETLITDDKRAIQKAIQHNIVFVTSEDFLITAKKAKLIHSIRAILDRMRKAGEGIEEDIYLETLELAGEL